MPKDWLEIHRKITIPVEEITGINAMTDTKGVYHVRLKRKTPVIDFICENKQDASDFYKALLKSCHIVDFESYKFGK